MKHFGDITKINGHEVPLVDIVCGGSPCQDLSVAGKRAGLSGERSGLFMEQIRIIKEMRDECASKLSMRGADVDRRLLRPRYMVWENVPGAFSSNGGQDFRAVLEETARIVCEDAVVPGPSGGRWSPSGCIMGDGWSIAWRLHDAQFWGVPQRRKRIALVADFGGESAPEILFERQGMSGDPEESRAEKEGTSTTFEGNIGEAVGCAWDGSQTSPTITANNAGGSQRMPDKENFNAVITYALDRAAFNQGLNAKYDFSVEEELAQTMLSTGPGGVLTEIHEDSYP